MQASNADARLGRARVIALLAVFALWSTVKAVPQGHSYTIENFGRYTRSLPPGLHILVPIVERVGHKVNMKEQVMDIPSQDIITRDNAMVKVDGIAFPSKETISVDGEKSGEVTYDRIQINPALPAGLFDFPSF